MTLLSRSLKEAVKRSPVTSFGYIANFNLKFGNSFQANIYSEPAFRKKRKVLFFQEIHFIDPRSSSKAPTSNCRKPPAALHSAQVAWSRGRKSVEVPTCMETPWRLLFRSNYILHRMQQNDIWGISTKKRLQLSIKWWIIRANKSRSWKKKIFKVWAASNMSTLRRQPD